MYGGQNITGSPEKLFFALHGANQSLCLRVRSTVLGTNGRRKNELKDKSVVKSVFKERYASGTGDTVSKKNGNVPLKNPIVPVKVRIVPEKNTIVPAKSGNVPTKNAIAPAKVRDVPTKNAIVPAKVRDVSTKNAIVPTKVRDVSIKNTIVPAKNRYVSRKKSCVHRIYSKKFN